MNMEGNFKKIRIWLLIIGILLIIIYSIITAPIACVDRIDSAECYRDYSASFYIIGFFSIIWLVIWTIIFILIPFLVVKKHNKK